MSQTYGRGGVAILVGLAVVAIIAELAARGLAPALPGVWIGAEHAITLLKLVAAVSSQLFAVGSTLAVIGLVIATVSSPHAAGQGSDAKAPFVRRADNGVPGYFAAWKPRELLPGALRAFSVGVGVLTILAVMIASAVKLPEVSRTVLSVGAAALALASAKVATRFYTSRAPALVCAAIAISGVVRVAAIVLAGRASADKEMALAVAARATATASLALVFAAVLVALLWMARTPRIGRKRSLAGIAAIGLVLVASAVAAYLAQLGSDPEAEGVALLVARTFEQLVARPLPYGPASLYAIFEAARFVTALSLLIVAPRSRAMGAVVALALIAGGTLEVPLCAAALVVASLALLLHPGPDLRHDVPPGERDGPGGAPE